MQFKYNLYVHFDHMLAKLSIFLAHMCNNLVPGKFSRRIVGYICRIIMHDAYK